MPGILPGSLFYAQALAMALVDRYRCLQIELELTFCISGVLQEGAELSRLTLDPASYALNFQNKLRRAVLPLFDCLSEKGVFIPELHCSYRPTKEILTFNVIFCQEKNNTVR